MCFALCTRAHSMKNVNCGNATECRGRNRYMYYIRSMNPISSKLDHWSKALRKIHRLRRDYGLGIRHSGKTTSWTTALLSEILYKPKFFAWLNLYACCSSAFVECSETVSVDSSELNHWSKALSKSTICDATMACMGTIGCNLYACSLRGFRKMQGNCSRARPEVTKTGKASFSRRLENCSSLRELTRKLHRDGVERDAQHHLPWCFKSSQIPFAVTLQSATLW